MNHTPTRPKHRTNPTERGHPVAHKDTPADWTGAIIVMIGSTICALGCLGPNWPIIILGALIALGGIIARNVMARVAKQNNTTQ